MTVAEFLLARIAEDEMAAEAVEMEESADQWRFDLDAKGRAAFEHIVRHSPERVLAECEAKRRIVGRHHRIRRWGSRRRLIDLNDLAAVYSDHSDYRDEWKL